METAIKILFDGMEKRLFTGKKLADYDRVLFIDSPTSEFNFYASRAIINDDLAANGAKTDAHGKACLAGLQPENVY